MNNTILAGASRPIIGAAIALVLTLGSIAAGVGTYAFAQEDATATPTIEEQTTTPEVDDATPADDATEDDATGEDDASEDDGSTEEESDGRVCDHDKDSSETETEETGTTL